MNLWLILHLADTFVDLSWLAYLAELLRGQVVHTCIALLRIDLSLRLAYFLLRDNGLGFDFLKQLQSDLVWNIAEIRWSNSPSVKLRLV